jgi:hypothetical protein
MYGIEASASSDWGECNRIQEIGVITSITVAIATIVRFTREGAAAALRPRRARELAPGSVMTS